MTPFRDATALEVVPLHLVLTLFTRKNDMTWARHIHIKEGKNIDTDNLLLSTSGREISTLIPVKVKAPVSLQINHKRL